PARRGGADRSRARGSGRPARASRRRRKRRDRRARSRLSRASRSRVRANRRCRARTLRPRRQPGDRRRDARTRHAGRRAVATGSTVNLAGHDDAWRAWRAAIDSPRMHHGWILAGKRGIGKAAFALAAARELVAEPGVAPSKGDHPDVIVLEPLPATADDEKKRDEGKPYQRKRNISVDQVRAMQQRLTTRPTLGARRAIVIDPADDLEKSAAN